MLELLYNVCFLFCEGASYALLGGPETTPDDADLMLGAEDGAPLRPSGVGGSVILEGATWSGDQSQALSYLSSPCVCIS